MFQETSVKRHKIIQRLTANGVRRMNKDGNFNGYCLLQQLAPPVLRTYTRRSHVYTRTSFIQTSRKRCLYRVSLFARRIVRVVNNDEYTRHKRNVSKLSFTLWIL